MGVQVLQHDLVTSCRVFGQPRGMPGPRLQVRLGIYGFREQSFRPGFVIDATAVSVAHKVV